MLQRGWLFSALEEHFEAGAVVQIFAGVNLEADVDADFVEFVEDRASSAWRVRRTRFRRGRRDAAATDTCRARRARRRNVTCAIESEIG